MSILFKYLYPGLVNLSFSTRIIFWSFWFILYWGWFHFPWFFTTFTIIDFWWWFLSTWLLSCFITRNLCWIDRILHHRIVWWSITYSTHFLGTWIYFRLWICQIFFVTWFNLRWNKLIWLVFLFCPNHFISFQYSIALWTSLFIIIFFTFKPFSAAMRMEKVSAWRHALNELIFFEIIKTDNAICTIKFIFRIKLMILKSSHKLFLIFFLSYC